ncbi:MAG: cyclic nucleotide-binding domain-containing protein [Pseudomonadota bacterium]
MAVESEVLAKLYPLDTMHAKHRDLLAQEGMVEDLSREDVVFEAGANDGQTIFLLSGRLAGRYSDGREREIDANSPNTRYAVGDLQPRRFTATVASAAARVIRFDRGFLEKVLTWDQISRSPQFALQGASESAAWVFRMLKSRALLRLPAGNVQRMFECFEQQEIMPEQTVIQEGDEGDYFYVIKRGEFEVLKNDGDQNKVVAVLSDGESFGEDALISNDRRNATVKARTAGTLMRLSKRDFADLLKHPVVDWITPGQASALTRHGGMVVDVLLEDEFERVHLRDAVNAPLFRLREEMHNHSKELPYVVYCETGERSASAAFILSKLGYRAYAIRGGLSSIRQLLQMTGAQA